jgi:hypothetical protein
VQNIFVHSVCKIYLSIQTPLRTSFTVYTDKLALHNILSQLRVQINAEECMLTDWIMLLYIIHRMLLGFRENWIILSGNRVANDITYGKMPSEFRCPYLGLRRTSHVIVLLVICHNSHCISCTWHPLTLLQDPLSKWSSLCVIFAYLLQYLNLQRKKK